MKLKKAILNRSLIFIKKYKNYSDEELQKLKYGLEGIYLTITKIILIFILSILLNIFKEVLVLILLFNILRYFGFGFHAKKSIECLILSILIFILMPFVLLKINFNNSIFLVISIICTILLSIFAPADTIKRPLPRTKKKIFRKFVTIILSIFYLLIGLYIKNNNLKILLLSSIIIETILVNPITYRIFRQPYNNYKKVD